ncbi:P-loop containing nucleoside triphosphate hydrolase protein [Globomyces pollinis-pini]|nr:P-loop containing nucleoside triphosphate hydrolase protein [Globomyces pollinis-pini]
MTINETFVILDDTIQPCPRRQDSSWYSQGTYSYITELLNRGYKRELSILDYPAVESNDEAQLLAGKILDDWNVELKKENPKLLHTLVRIFGLHFGLAGISYFLEGIAQLMEGYFLSRLLLWFQTPNAPVDEVYWYGGFLSLALFIHGILHHVQFFETMRVGMRLRVGLTAAIYQKCLELSISNTQSTGLIVNLVSNDVQRFEDAAPFAHFFWAGPVQLLTLSYFIYREVGWSFLAGTIGVLLLIPIQGYFATAFKRLRQITVAYRDDRIKNISDMFAGIMVVKLYAWEIPFKEKINQLRNLELKFIWRGNILKSVNESIFFASSAIINTLIFSSFHFSGGKLSPAIVFSVITYIQYIKLSMTNFFPKSIQFLSECQVSLTRIQEFLSLESISTGAQENDTLDQAFGDEDYVLVGENASFAWESSQLGAKEGTQPKTVLSSMNFKISRKSLNILCGPVGSGKTSFLHSLIGDLCLTSGKVHFGTRKISFAAQTPWILSGTIRENIVFGAEYKHDRFLKVLECCSLERDISMFEHGVDTILGERGVTLSGGQRARVALARAIYYEADVYLLDDPLSAVDTKVGRNLFENCIMKFLADKTIILVTHQLQYLKDCKSIFLMNNGNLEQVGSCKEVFELYPEMSKSVESDSSQFEHEEISNEPELKLSKLRHQTIYRNPSERNTVLVKEESAVGNITLQTYWRFLKSGGGVSGGILLVFMLILGQVIAVAADIWLSRWSSATDINQRDSIWFTVLVVLSLSTLLAAVLRGLFFFTVCINSSSSSFREMLYSVVRSPISFFQSVPHGRLMNRFAKDINLMDEMLPQTLFDFLQVAFMVAASFVLSFVYLPFLIAIVPFVIIAFVFLRRKFLQTSRQVKRMESVTRSPIYSSIPSTLEGLSTIRALRAEDRFKARFVEDQNENSRVYFSYLSCNRWFGFRLDLLASFIVSLAIFSCIFLRNTFQLSPGILGLVLSYLIQLTGSLQWCVRQSCEVENLMVSTERVYEYTGLDSEANEETEASVPNGWPSQGKVEIRNMSLTYPNLQDPSKPGSLVLKKLLVTFEPGTKIGIVGRTGAGKSSFLQALFRLVEPSPQDSVYIDDISTSSLGLRTLRSSISIIPQDPFCFKGTLRFNLDPFDKYSDSQIWDALRAVELHATVDKLPDKLESAVAENGSNWSVGERQLICLARAILKNTKLIVMDEATSSVDMNTDKLIQRAIRAKGGLFSNSTVLTIAHRLNTVIDYDKILVLEAGEIVEFGTPKELIIKDVNDPTAWFARMVQQMGPEARNVLINLALKQ